MLLPRTNKFKCAFCQQSDVDTVSGLPWTHPQAYSPDFTPYSYHTFRQLKDVLHGCQFANKEVKGIVHMWLYTQSKSFFTDAIRKFKDQSNKCVEKLGDYIKNDSTFVLVGLLQNKDNEFPLLSEFPSYLL
jgi:hypothetical protein